MKSGARLRWRLALRSGVPFALLMAGFDLIQGETLALAGLRGLLAGVFFGVAMSLFDARYLQRDASVMTRAARRGLSVPERKLVQRATRNGPIPSSTTLRRAALALAEHQQQQFAALKSFVYTVNGLFILLGALVAVTQSSWLWLGAAFFAGQIVHSWWYERRAGERLDELRTYNTDTFSAVDK